VSRLIAADGYVLLTAHKPWTTGTACNWAIEPPQRYLKDLGEADAYASRNRYRLTGATPNRAPRSAPRR
jgi:hypothetical protein